MNHDDQPVSGVKWVSLAQVQANDYNPNSVADNELHLLYTSILHDGYTQPVVCVYDSITDKYIIVDGFHRHLVMKLYPDIYERTGGELPVVVIDKPINDRMASTIRHNRARGKHSVAGMSNMVFNMLENGMDDAAICRDLGMEADELVRMKYISGFAKLFENTEYRKAWETTRQIRLKKEWQDANGKD